jgi:hypothetical protein
MPCGLDDVGNARSLQRWGCGARLVRKLLTKLLARCSYTSVGRSLRDRAVKLTPGRLIEQDEVSLMRGQIQMLELLLLRGWCRQAR